MIRKTIDRTMDSTFIVEIPRGDLYGMAAANGTGFFISADGYFVTAKHVVDDVDDFSKVRLTRPIDRLGMVQYLTLIETWANYDIALLKADFDQNKEKQFLVGKTGFPYLEIEFEDQIEGTPVYSYGFPLPEAEVAKTPGITICVQYVSPRVTSAIISSTKDILGPVFVSGHPTFYAIDKALNYGNSGGPIVLTETGKVISVCVRFQPMQIPQNPDVYITVPSLYGITSSLKNIQDYLVNTMHMG